VFFSGPDTIKKLTALLGAPKLDLQNSFCQKMRTENIKHNNERKDKGKRQEASESNG